LMILFNSWLYTLSFDTASVPVIFAPFNVFVHKGIRFVPVRILLPDEPGTFHDQREKPPAAKALQRVPDKVIMMRPDERPAAPGAMF